MSSRVTMSDVARKAGVSLMTVSRVINNKEGVSSETRQDVLDIISSLGYRPSAIARSLATQETRTIGLVLPDVTNPFFADITRGVELLAYSQGYHVFLCNADEDSLRELAVIQSLEENRVDGLILCSSRLTEEKLLELLVRQSAVVLINRSLRQTNGHNSFNSITIDDRRSGWLATRHLISSGHQQVGFLAGPSTSFSSAGRLQGYQTALQEAGITPAPDWMSYCPPSVEGGYEAARQLLVRQPDLTALFCFNDLVAVGAIKACGELNRRIPADIAIVGHDDIPLAALVSPALTTCRVPRHELGVRAVEALLELLHGCPSGCQQIALQSELIIRQSAP